MNRIFVAALLAALPFAAGATDWDVQTGPDTWEKNPACTGQCEKDRAAAMEPSRPKPGAPIQIPGEKPKPPALVADKRDREPVATERARFWCIAPTGQIARVNKIEGKAPPRATLRACGWDVHADGKLLGEW